MDTAIAVALISGGAAVGGAIGTMWTNRNINRLNLQEKKLAERRGAIAKKLNEFYGPLYSRLNVVRALYKIFKLGKPEKFRTLTYLLDRDQLYETDDRGKVKVVLSANEEVLLQDIVDLERDIERLINDKAGLIDDAELTAPFNADSAEDGKYPEGTSLLSALVAHFRILRLAHEGKLQGDLTGFGKYVYPRPIDARIAAKINQLKAELDTMAGS